jgi:hypothetical protein
MFKQINTIISATSKTTNINNKKINKILENYNTIITACKDSNNKLLYRANKANNATPIFTISDVHRKSAATNNVYTVLISKILPSWENWPKRNESIIFTNDIWAASSYLNDEDFQIRGRIQNRALYNIFPNNNAKIAVCSSDDMWNSFQNIQNLDAFDIKFISLLNYACVQSGYKNYTKKAIEILFNKEDTEEILNILNITEKYIHSLDDNAIKKILQSGTVASEITVFSLIFHEIKHNNKNIIDTLDDIFNPIKNKFTLCDPSGLIKYIKKGNKIKEFYTTDECLLVLYPKYYNKLFNEGYEEYVSWFKENIYPSYNEN